MTTGAALKRNPKRATITKPKENMSTRRKMTMITNLKRAMIMRRKMTATMRRKRAMITNLKTAMIMKRKMTTIMSQTRRPSPAGTPMFTAENRMNMSGLPRKTA